MVGGVGYIVMASITNAEGGNNFIVFIFLIYNALCTRALLYCKPPLFTTHCVYHLIGCHFSPATLFRLQVVGAALFLFTQHHSCLCFNKNSHVIINETVMYLIPL